MAGFIPSGERGGFPVTVKTVSRMIDRGRTPIPASRAALELGYATARGVSDVLPAGRTDAPPALPGSGNYVGHQVQTLTGTDIRNFNRSALAKTGRVR